MTTPEQQLSHHLRPMWPRHWYGLAIVTMLTGSVSVVPLAYAALRRPPTDARLRQFLLLAARPQVSVLRKKLANRTLIGESNGLYFRAPSCIVGDITGSRIARNGPYVTGLVSVSCVWKSTEERTFGSREEAEDAELSENEVGKLRLTFAWLDGKWLYKGAKKD